MLPADCLHELRSSWLPNMTDSGLDRIIELLEQGSPYLISGSFTRVPPMGCLATQVAWHHPKTAHLTLDAGICWLHRVADLNPATSRVLREWDRGATNLEYRADLLAALKEHQAERRKAHPADNRIAKYVSA